MTIRLLQGDMRVTLATLPEKSISACVTSPPYYSLRDYGTPPLVWGGDAGHSPHEWQTFTREGKSGGLSPKQVTNVGAYHAPTSQATCPCGAWLGSLGLEPTPELFVEHLVECFRAVWRVLRDDGCMFVNLGDSYAGSGPSGASYQSATTQRRNGTRQDGAFAVSQTLEDRGLTYAEKKPVPAPGYKAKDLMEIPSMVAQALRADGWYLRSRIPWLKRNSMPESVTDRPATAVEYVFLLSKQARYFWDADAVRLVMRQPDNANGGINRGLADGSAPAIGTQQQRHGRNWIANAAGRSRRNSDWFFESWQGLLLDEQDEPLALIVNPAPYKAAHFATFGTKLVEPMLKASTSERGCCPTCGAPWRRVLETHRNGRDWNANNRAGGDRLVVGRSASDGMPRDYKPPTTNGWQPTCAHTEVVCPNGCTVVESIDGREEATTVAPVSDVRGDVPSMETRGQLLQPAVLHESTEDGNAEGVSVLRKDVPTERESSPVLRQVLLEHMGGATEAECTRLVPEHEGLPPDVPARPSDGIAGGLRGRASAGDRGSDRTITSTRRSGPPQEREQDGQPIRESGTDGQEGPRQGQEADVLGSVPTVSARVPDAGQCSRCGGRLEVRPLAPRPAVVLDCFGGAGTVGLVADRLGRNAVLCELKEDYADMGHKRLVGDAPLFTEVDLW